MSEKPSDENKQIPGLPERAGAGALAEPARTQTPAHLIDPSTRDVSDDEFSIDLLSYWRVLVKRRVIVLAVLAVVVLVAVIATLLMTPIYRATASLQIDRETVSVIQVDGLEPAERASADFHQTQFELLRSRALAERVQADLGLAADPRFMPEGGTSLTGLFRGLFSGAEESEAEGLEARRNAAIGMLQRNLSVEPVARSRIVRLHFNHPDRDVAQRVANGFSQAFIALNLERRFEASSYARVFLEERLEQIKASLEESERDLVAYAQAQGIVNVDERQSIIGSRLSAVNTGLNTVRQERVEAEALWRQAEASAGFGLPQVLESRTIQENRTRRAELAADYQNRLELFQPAFPAMVQLQAQIDELDRQAQAEIETIKESIRARFDATVAKERTLEADLEALKEEVLELRGRSIEYTLLQREVDTNRELYDGLLQRYKEIGVAGGVGTNNISLVDAATRPGQPASPNLTRNLALALVGGLMLGVMGALGIEYLDDTFKSPEDIETALALPVLGIVPKPKAGRSIEEELADLRSGMSEAYRSVRTTLQFTTADGMPRNLVVTSARPAEGKSTTSLSIGRQFAQLGLNVLVVDADLRNPSLHKRLGYPNDVGLSTFLTGATTPDKMIRTTQDANLYFLPSGPLPPNPAELIAGPRMTSLLTLGAQHFDLIVIDSPPIMGLADAPLLSSIAQGTLLVVAAGETRRDVARVALKRLQFARANVFGGLLNKFDVKLVGYGYGYGYGYGGEDYHAYGAAAVKDLSGTSVDGEQKKALA